MFKYIKIVAAILLISIVFTGCSSDRFIDRKANDYINSGNTDEEAHAWLLENEELVGEYLAKNLSSTNRSTAGKAKALLRALGDDGVQMVGSNYDLLASLGKENLAETIALQNTNTAVMQLLAFSTMEGGLEPCSKALLTMDTIAIKTIAPLINQNSYMDCVNYVMANYDNYATTDILPMVFDDEMSDRALDILALSEGDASTTLILAVLNKNNLDNQLVSDIASKVLINKKDNSIDTIINTIAKGEGNEEYGAIMLYELANDESCADVFNKCARSINASNTEQLLKSYIKLLGVSTPLAIVLDTPTDEIIAALSIGLDSPGYANECFVEIVRAIKPEDDSNSQLYKLAGQLISDIPLSQLAQAIIGTDTEMMNIALSTTQNMSDMSTNISKTSDNTVVYDRMSAMLNTSSGLEKKNILKVLSGGGNDTFPKLVWETYKSGTPEESQYALDALLSSTMMGVNFPYKDFDFMPYADRIIEDLKSDDSFIHSSAEQLIDKIPESKDYNDLYEYIFSQIPTQTVFQTLCMHHYGVNALPVELKIKGDDRVITQIDIDIDDVEIDSVAEDQYINFKSLTYDIIGSTGVEVVDSTEITLNIDIEQDPYGKKYPGMVSKSYLGAKSDVDITVYAGDSRQGKYSGTYQIYMPETLNIPEATIEYMQRPIDAPLSKTYTVALIDALYDVFGVEVLYGTYFYNRDATMLIAGEMWGVDKMADQQKSE